MNELAPEAMGNTLSWTERRILGLLSRRGPSTHSTLVAHTNLAQQSISRLVAGLIERGMVQEGERVRESRRGYPSTRVQLAPDHCFSVGVAIMANAVAVQLLDFAGTAHGVRNALFASVPLAGTMDWIEASITALLTAKGLSTRRLAGIGISISGSLIGPGKGFNTPFYLDDWAQIDLERLFTARFGLPALADNDGNAAALAESMVGVGRWASSFAYVYIGAGVGGGLVLNGELWRGRMGNAGEFAGGLPANIYPFPNLELLRQLVGKQGPAFTSVEAMVEAFDPGWTAIEDWIVRVADSMSIIASNASAILDLEAIVLGGRMPTALAERLIPRVEFFDQQRRSLPRSRAVIVPSETPGNAAAFGAAVLPLRAAYFS